jgi:solute carrier family 35 protein E1
MKVLSILLLSSAWFSTAFVPLRVAHVSRPGVATKVAVLHAHESPSRKSNTALGVGGEGTETPETPLRRFRRRKSTLLHKKKFIATSYLFALWYVFSIAYNIFSKNALNLAPSLAWTTATLQMSLGLAFVFPLWKSGVRQQPELVRSDLVRLLPVAILHSLVHIGGVVSMGAGAVSFTYIVKASEPAVSASLAALTGTILPTSVYLTLFPVMAGVAIASVSELSFTWKSFNYAMLSNLASAGRGIVGKKTLDQSWGKSMSASNIYAILTMMATCFLIPLALLMEGSVLSSTFQALRASNQLSSYLGQTFLASLAYYLYNEVSFLCLDNVSAVSHALGNTLKRVFIILSSMLVFGNRMTLRGALGSTLAVGGVLLYSMEKTRHSKKAKKKT